MHAAKILIQISTNVISWITASAGSEAMFADLGHFSYAAIQVPLPGHLVSTLYRESITKTFIFPMSQFNSPTLTKVVFIETLIST